MSGIDVDAQAANAGARAFGPGLVVCPDCGHGIDPHGSDPGGPCAVGGCPCLMQPNGIAHLIEAERAELRRWKEEALPVLTGLQELGNALGVPLGHRITGPEALRRVKELRATVARAEALHTPLTDDDGTYCSSDNEAWPCVTANALAGDQP